MNDKPWLNQLKIIACSTNFSEPLHCYKEGEIPTMKGKYSVLRTNTKPNQLFKHTKIYYCVAFLVFCKFCAVPTEMVYTELPQSRGTLSNSKWRTTLVWFLLYRIRILNAFIKQKYINKWKISIIVHREWYLPIFFCLKGNRSSFLRVSLESEYKDAHP